MNACSCCKRFEKKRHDCSHEFCEADCSKRRQETEANNKINGNIYINPESSFVKKIAAGNKPIIFGVKEIVKETEKKPLFFTIKK